MARVRSNHDHGEWIDNPDGSRLQLRAAGAEKPNEEPVLFMPWDWRASPEAPPTRD